MDLSTLSLAELKELAAQIPGEIKKREKDEKTRIRKEIETMAAKAGFSLDELLGEAKAAMKGNIARKPVAPKYQHPQDKSLVWTGRGRQPKWVAEFLSNGGTLDQLSLPGATF